MNHFLESHVQRDESRRTIGALLEGGSTISCKLILRVCVVLIKGVGYFPEEWEVSRRAPKPSTGLDRGS